jgi:hypothetical protein
MSNDISPTHLLYISFSNSMVDLKLGSMEM